MKRKQKWLLLLMCSMLLLAGWGTKQVELLNDKKLIDLNAALGNCILGAEDMIPDEGDNTQNQDAPSATPGPTVNSTPMPTATPKLTATPTPTTQPKPTLPAKPKVLDISIRDQVVTYNYVPWPDLDILREQIKRDHNERTTFCLIDDFAEAHVYRQVMDMLEELKNEIGLNYTQN